VTVGNAFQDDLALGDELYSLELELAAQESSIEKGNIFLTATVQGADKPIVYHRMGHMRPRSPLMLAAKHTLWYVPLGNWFISTSQTLRVPIVDSLKNRLVHTQAIDITISQSHITFNSAILNVRTVVQGPRYLMRHWFFTTALLSVTASFFFACWHYS